MNRMVETLEDRRLMSAVTVGSLVAGGGGVETTGLLLPAVQKIREAASASSAGAGPGGGPVVKLYSGSDGGANAAGHHSGGVNVGLGDGSVRFVG